MKIVIVAALLAIAGFTGYLAVTHYQEAKTGQRIAMMESFDVCVDRVNHSYGIASVNGMIDYNQIKLVSPSARAAATQELHSKC